MSPSRRARSSAASARARMRGATGMRVTLAARFAFFQKRLELGDHFEVLWPTCSPLCTNQRFESQNAARSIEQAHLDGVRKNVVVCARSSDLSENVERP